MVDNVIVNVKLREMCRRVRIEKIHDKNFSGEHPHGINEGYTKTGFMFRVPRIGERLMLFAGKIIHLGDAISAFVSSEITEIQDGGIVYTENSIYTVLIENYNSNGHPYWEPLDPARVLASLT